MSNSTDQILQLLRQSLDLNEGDEQISLQEQAVRLADAFGDLSIKYRVRELYVRACIFGGAPEKGLVAFSWLLSQFDRNPGQFDEWSILWKYKWIIGIVSHFPHVSKPRIFEMLDDFSERSLKAGFGLRAAYTHRYRLARFWDDRESALGYYEDMRNAPIDDLANCSACELNEQIGFAIYLGDDLKAVNQGGELLAMDKKCATVPQRTYASLLLPLVRLKRLRQAMIFHRRGYELIESNKSFIDKIADHLIFLAVTRNFEKAVEVFRKHYPLTERNHDALHRFHFFRAAWLLFSMLAESKEGGAQNGSLALAMPSTFPLYAQDGMYDISKLAEWTKQEADALAARFDKRNETDFFARTLKEMEDIAEARP